MIYNKAVTEIKNKYINNIEEDIENLDERVDALEAGGSGGGVELSALDITVTFTGENHVYTGLISSTIPDNTVITDVIKIERVDVQGSGQNATTQITPLPTLTGRTDLSNTFTLQGYETYARISPASSYFPLGIVFSKIDVSATAAEITETFKITYV